MSFGDEVILRFLEIGIVDVGADDTKLEKIRLAVADLVASVKADPSRTQKYTMVAADPDIRASDPVIVEAMAVLKKHWITVSNTFQATPTAIIRAMLVDALVQAARKDDGVAVAFVNTARNTLPYSQVANERPIWLDVVAEIESLVDKRAEFEWSTPETISVPNFAFQPPAQSAQEVPEIAIDRDALNASLLGATGPHAQGSNPHYPHNNPQPWGIEFAKRASKGIADAFNEALADLNIEPIDIGQPLSALCTAINDHLDSTLASFSRSTAGLQRRTSLLWWKESMYSPSARAGYRDFPAFSAAALMAVDLHTQLPTFSPASVAFFLSEAIQILPTVQNAGETEVKNIIEEVRTVEALDYLRRAASELVASPAGRTPLIAVLGFPEITGEIDDTKLQELVGMPVGYKMSPIEWGAYIFRELQAARAAKSSKPKNARSKA
jgi:hypothetical protein